jgi:hypothetical protein
MCVCATGLVVSSVLREVTYHRPVHKICFNIKTSGVFLDINIYNIGESTDYTDVGFSCLYSDPPGKYSYCVKTVKPTRCYTMVY